MATAIGTLGNVPTLNIGGMVFVDLTTLIVLTGYGNGANARSSLRKQNGSAGYAAVTSMKIYATDTWFTTSSANNFVRLNYGDNDLGLASTTAVTNQVFWSNDGNDASYIIPPGAAASAHFYTFPFFAVPVGKFTNSESGGQGEYTVRYYGYDA